MIAVALRYHLANLADVAAIVGDRIYFQSAPPLVPPPAGNAQLPFIVFYRISTPRERHLRGSLALPHPRWQITCYGLDAIVLESLALAIRMGLDTKRNYDMGPSDDQVNVRSAILEDERDSYEPPEHGDQFGVYRKDLDFTIWHREVVPA